MAGGVRLPDAHALQDAAAAPSAMWPREVTTPARAAPPPGRPAARRPPAAVPPAPSGASLAFAGRGGGARLARLHGRAGGYSSACAARRRRRSRAGLARPLPALSSLAEERDAAGARGAGVSPR